MKILETFKLDDKLAQFVRFVLVGGMATVIHYAIYLILNKKGVPINIAYTMGYSLSFIFNFFASNYFTFKAKPTAKGGVGFLGAHLFNYFLQVILLNTYLFVGIPESIAPIGVFIIAIPTNFVLVRLALKK